MFRCIWQEREWYWVAKWVLEIEDSKMGFGQRSVSRIDLKRKKTAEGVKRSEGVTICVGYENRKDR